MWQSRDSTTSGNDQLDQIYSSFRILRATTGQMQLWGLFKNRVSSRCPWRGGSLQSGSSSRPSATASVNGSLAVTKTSNVSKIVSQAHEERGLPLVFIYPPPRRFCQLGKYKAREEYCHTQVIIRRTYCHHQNLKSIISGLIHYPCPPVNMA